MVPVTRRKHSKITPELFIAIKKKAPKAGKVPMYTRGGVASRFNVSVGTVSHIWNHNDFSSYVEHCRTMHGNSKRDMEKLTSECQINEPTIENILDRIVLLESNLLIAVKNISHLILLTHSAKNGQTVTETSSNTSGDISA
jgi:hypothetical protein